ncbi:MAG: hypothetical protein JWL83_4063 [Actinomycetia bacterium]|nr:hypothetical protein [Actinomycetes bacterium]
MTTALRALRPRRPVLLDTALDDPTLLWNVARQYAPYSNRACSDAPLIGEDAPAPRTDPAKLLGEIGFRETWSASFAPPRPVDRLLHNARFVEAAHDVFQGHAIVRPHELRMDLDLSIPLLLPQAGAAPHFRGLASDHYPQWFRVLLQRSGLFEEWRVSTAVAVTWTYPGPGGSFTYLPEGRLARPSRWRPPAPNAALVTDIDALCPPVDPWAHHSWSDAISAGSTLDYDAARDEWIVTDRGRTVATCTSDNVHIALWWTALVFRDEDERRTYDDHLDDLSPRLMADLLVFDLRDRGFDVSPTRTPVRDLNIVTSMLAAYGG